MTRASILLLPAAAFAVAMVVVAFVSPRTAAAGWLIAFTYVSLFPLGSLTWLMIHRLTGGRWGRALYPFLRPLAQTTPLLLLLVIPVLVATPVLFSWTQAAATPSVHAIYLNIPAYVVRSFIALAGWSVLAIVVPSLPGSAGRIAAGLGLLFHGIAISFMAQDWMLAAEPPFISTSFGASVAFVQLLAALALAAAIAPRSLDLPDLGGLILVVILGITYTDFMAVLVMWYGDVPAKIFWFAQRVQEPWRMIAIAIFVLASLVPVVLLMFARIRMSRVALRAIGAVILVGLALYQAWLLAPVFGGATLGTAVLALLAMGTALSMAAMSDWLQGIFHRWRTAHGR